MKRLIAVAALAALTLPGCAEARTRLSGAGLGLFTGGGVGQLWIQIVGCIAYAVWTVVTCYVTWKVIGAAFGGIRVTEEQEKIGLDITEHGIEAYPDYAMSGSGVGNR